MTRIPDETKQRGVGVLEDIGTCLVIDPHARELPPGAASELDIEDWSLLLGAGLERLRSVIDALQCATARRVVQDDREAEWLRVKLQECLQDLAALRTTMTQKLQP